MNKNTGKTFKKGFTFFKNNDVLLAKITPCFENGKSAVAQNLINGIGAGSTEFMVFRCNESILPKYLYFNLNTDSFRQNGTLNMSGSVGHKRVPKEFVLKLEHCVAINNRTNPNRPKSRNLLRPCRRNRNTSKGGIGERQFAHPIHFSQSLQRGIVGGMA